MSVEVGNVIIVDSKKYLVEDVEESLVSFVDVIEATSRHVYEVVCSLFELSDWPHAIDWNAIWSEAIATNCKKKSLKKKALQFLEDEDWNSLHEMMPDYFDKFELVEAEVYDNTSKEEVDWDLVRIEYQCSSLLLQVFDMTTGNKVQAQLWIDRDNVQFVTAEDENFCGLRYNENTLVENWILDGNSRNYSSAVVIGG